MGDAADDAIDSGLMAEFYGDGPSQEDAEEIAASLGVRRRRNFPSDLELHSPRIALDEIEHTIDILSNNAPKVRLMDLVPPPPNKKAPVQAQRPPPPSGPTPTATAKPVMTPPPTPPQRPTVVPGPTAPAFKQTAGTMGATGLEQAKGYGKYLDKPEYAQYSLDASKPSDFAPITILVEGEKNASKSCAAAGIPRKYGGKTYFITADNTTLDGLANYYFPRKTIVNGEEKLIWDYHFANDIKKGNLVVYEVCKRFFDPATGKEKWPGYDPNRPWTAELVYAKTMRLLEEIERKNDGDVIVIDHFQEFYENVMKSLILFHNKGPNGASLDPAFAKIGFQQWEERTRVMTLLEYKARCVSRFATVITGYGEEEKLTMVADIDPTTGTQRKDENGKDKFIVVKENKAPKWIEKFQRNYIVVLRLSSYKKMDTRRAGEKVGEAAAKTSFLCEVKMSKRQRFPQGEVVDITHSSLEKFWENPDPTLDQPVNDEGESTTAVAVDIVPIKAARDEKADLIASALAEETALVPPPPAKEP